MMPLNNLLKTKSSASAVQKTNNRDEKQIEQNLDLESKPEEF